MIKWSLSLKSSILVTFFSITVLIVVGYSVMSYAFFFRGMDNIMSANMEKAMKLSLEQQAGGIEVNSLFHDYVVTSRWQQQPKEVRQAFKTPPEKVGKLHIKVDKLALLPSKVRYFVIMLEEQGQRYFISYQGVKEKVSPLLRENADASKRLLIGVSLAVTLLLIALVGFFLRKVSQPLMGLNEWMHQLSPEKLTTSPPDFVYPELNDMAQLIQRSLHSVNASLQREQDFLHFTSHELRTPISVIRNNIDLFRKLEQTQDSEKQAKKQETIDRIDRASLTMKHVSEVLLWLSRENVDILPHQSCQLDMLIKTMVDELRYLLNNKPVTVELQLQATETMLPVTVVQIVIGNLIRNAFQHTWDGNVVIEQVGTTVTIVNHCRQFQSEAKQEQGFGLGLRLTQALCQKLDWPYQNHEISNGHHVQLTVKAQTSSTATQI